MAAMADGITSTDDLSPYVLDGLFDSFNDESLSDVDDQNNHRIRFHVLSVHTVVNIPLFIRNPYMFLMTSRYSESLFIGTFVYGRSIRITHRNAEIRMLKGEWGHS